MECDPTTVAPVIYQSLFYWSLLGLILVSLYAWMLHTELKWTKNDKGWFPVEVNSKKNRAKKVIASSTIGIKEPSDEAQLRM